MEDRDVSPLLEASTSIPQPAPEAEWRSALVSHRPRVLLAAALLLGLASTGVILSILFTGGEI